MKILTVAILISSGLAVSLPAKAGVHKEGRTLHGECSADQRDPVFFQKSSGCLGYLSGAIDSWMLDRRLAKKSECVPTVTGLRAKQILVSYVESNPEDLKLPAAMLVRLAFSSEFPECLL